MYDGGGDTTANIDSQLPNSTSSNYTDITDTWHDHIPRGVAEVRDSSVPVDKNGNEYNSSELILRNSRKEEEHRIADLLFREIHSIIEVIPEVEFPLGCPTPDFRIMETGEVIELKTLEKIPPNENAIYNSVKRAREQASFVITDMSIYPYEDLIEKQISDIFRRDATAFVDRLMLIRNDEIIGVYKRV